MTGPAVRIAAQAKLNLHLRVLAREDSGFHSLETIFHRIDLADELFIEITPQGKYLDVQGADVGPAESNLAWRAAQLFSDYAGWPKGFSIELVKRIPHGAGLGGGSADAAAVLRALNSIAPAPVSQNILLAMAFRLGSDVPFLASESVMALAWGHGERMLSLPPLPRYDILLMTPDFSVSTADAYRWLDEDRSNAGGYGIAPALAVDTVDLSTWRAIAKFAVNDFETSVSLRHPALREYLDRLRNSRAIFSAMTGSGSTIFGVLDSPPNYAKVPEEHRSRVTTTKTSIDVVQPERVG